MFITIFVVNPPSTIRIGKFVDGFLKHRRLLSVRSASKSKIDWLIRRFKWHEAVGPDGIGSIEL
jgi:hypothetical protein